MKIPKCIEQHIEEIGTVNDEHTNRMKLSSQQASTYPTAAGAAVKKTLSHRWLLCYYFLCRKRRQSPRHCCTSPSSSHLHRRTNRQSRYDDPGGLKETTSCPSRRRTTITPPLEDFLSGVQALESWPQSQHCGPPVLYVFLLRTSWIPIFHFTQQMESQEKYMGMEKGPLLGVAETDQLALWCCPVNWFVSTPEFHNGPERTEAHATNAISSSQTENSLAIKRNRQQKWKKNHTILE